MVEKLFRILLVVGMVFMSSCSQYMQSPRRDYCKIMIGDSMSTAREAFTTYNNHLVEAEVFKDEENFVVVIERGGVISGIAVFSPDRQLLYSEGITPIDDRSITQVFGMSLENMEGIYGSVHCDIGSGFSIPAYITNKATIVFFQTEDGIVTRVGSIDIITNTETLLIA